MILLEILSVFCLIVIIVGFLIYIDSEKDKRKRESFYYKYMRTDIFDTQEDKDKKKANEMFSTSTIKNEKVFKSSNLNNRLQSFEENFNSNNIKNKKYNKKLLKQNKKLKKLIKEYKHQMDKEEYVALKGEIKSLIEVIKKVSGK